MQQRGLICPLRCTLTVREVAARAGARGGRLAVQVEPLGACWARLPSRREGTPRAERAPAAVRQPGLERAAAARTNTRAASTSPGPAPAVDLVGARGAVAASTPSARPAAPHRPGPPLAGALAQPRMGERVEALFRAEAVQARHQEAAVETLPEVSTSWWVLLGVLASAVAVLLGVGWFGRVEVTSTAVGSLRVKSGPRPVLAQASGTVAELMVAAGDWVREGQPVLKLQAARLEAEQQRLADQLSLKREGEERARALSSRLHQRTLRALKRKRRILGQRLELEGGRVARLARREEDVRTLLREGAASGTEALDARSALDAVRERALVLRQQLADISIELLDRENAYGSDLLKRELGIQQSSVELNEAQVLAKLAVLAAPVEGRVESLLVSAGQVVPTGATVARIVPEGDFNRAVVFVASKDAAFVREGLAANLEFPSLPVSDFGRARARVERVAHDVASRAELAEVLDGSAPTADALVRVELVIDDDSTWREMAPRLRSGARVTARLMTSERRVLSLAFDFVKQWLPE